MIFALSLLVGVFMVAGWMVGKAFQKELTSDPDIVTDTVGLVAMLVIFLCVVVFIAYIAG